MCDLGDFKAPTQEDVEWNVEVEKENLLVKTYAFKEGDRLVGKALVGRLHKDLAIPLYETTLQHMDVEHGGAKIITTDGKKQFVTILLGITNCDLHVGEHDAKAQGRATVLIDTPMLTTKSREVWPELYAFYEAAQKRFGSKFRPVVAHILFGKSTQVAFEYHWDLNQHKKEVHLSFIAELGNSQSTMCIAGEQEMTYDLPGSYKLFDAQLMHRSGVSYADTIKIAIFFEELDDEGNVVKKKKKKETTTAAAAAAAAAAAPVPAEAEVEGQAAEDTSELARLGCVVSTHDEKEPAAAAEAMENTENKAAETTEEKVEKPAAEGAPVEDEAAEQGATEPVDKTEKAKAEEAEAAKQTTEAEAAAAKQKIEAEEAEAAKQKIEAEEAEAAKKKAAEAEAESSEDVLEAEEETDDEKAKKATAQSPGRSPRDFVKEEKKGSPTSAKKEEKKKDSSTSVKKEKDKQAEGEPLAKRPRREPKARGK